MNKLLVGVVSVMLVLVLGGIVPGSAQAPSNSLPLVWVLSTGGTIAGRGASPTNVADYKGGQILGEDLVKAVPEIKQFGAAINQEFDPLGKRIELAQQRDAGRLQCHAQRPLSSNALGRFSGLDQRFAAALDLVVIDIKFTREQLQETLAPGGVEREIGAAKIRGAGARRYTAAPAIEAAQHLLVKPAGVLAREIGPGAAGQNAAGGFGDVAPCAPEVCQRPVEHALKETGGSGIGHGGSCGSGWRRTRRE